MAQIGGPNSKFEKLFKESVKELEKRIEYRTQRISSILESAYNKPKPTAKYWREVRVALDKEYAALSRIYSTWAKKNIPVAYKAGMKELFDRLNRSKTIAKRASRSFTSLVTSTRSKLIQEILVRDAIADYNAALTLGKGNLTRLTRRTQQTLVSEAAINKSVASAIEAGNLMSNSYIRTIIMPETLAAQLDEMATIIDGTKYVIAGSRRFSPKYYAEMVSRVKFHEAQAQAAMETAKNYGTSLVQVSSHNTTTEICQKFEGGVYSIDGKDKRFPPLMDTPPYHPNCLHLLFPMFESAMEVDGSLDGWIAFSKGETGTPPSPSNFIPVKERTA